MPDLGENWNGSGDGAKRPRGRGGAARPDPAAYAALVASGAKREHAAVVAGYSPGTHVSQIEQNPVVANALQTVEQQRQAAKRLQGAGLVDSVRFALDIRDSAVEKTSDRLKADKAVREVLGYNAPTESVQEHRYLIAEFRDVPLSALTSMIEYRSDETAV